jgi:hypothetical protein
MHLNFGFAPPRCPKDGLDDLAYPSLVFVNIVQIVLAAIFTIVCAVRYNSVRVFNQKISTANTSNTCWIVFFISSSIWSIISAIKYALDDSKEAAVDAPFVIIALLLYGVAPLFLSWALNHQRRFRSSYSMHRPHQNAADHDRHRTGASIAPGHSANIGVVDERSALTGGDVERSGEVDPLLRRYRWCRQRIGISELTFVALFVVYTVVMSVSLSNTENDTLYYVFVGAYGLQRVPITVLVLVIVLRPDLPYYGIALPSDVDGPSRTAKVLLVAAALFAAADLLPLSMWARILPSTCPFYVASWVDAIQVLYILSLLFFFLFTRVEYFRNLEEEIWSGFQTVRLSTSSAVSAMPLSF